MHALDAAFGLSNALQNELSGALGNVAGKTIDTRALFKAAASLSGQGSSRKSGRRPSLLGKGSIRRRSIFGTSATARHLPCCCVSVLRVHRPGGCVQALGVVLSTSEQDISAGG